MGEEVYTMTMHNFSSHKALFKQAYELTQRFSFLFGSGAELNELFAEVQLVYRIVSVMDNEGTYLELEKNVGGIKTTNQEISEVERIVRDHQQKVIVSAVLSEHPDIVRELNRRPYIFTDVNNQRYAIYQPSPMTRFSYICSEKGELISLESEYQGYPTEKILLGIDGTMQTICPDMETPRQLVDTETMIYIRDFYEELEDWALSLLSRER
jgi:hypothetical protein